MAQHLATLVPRKFLSLDPRAKKPLLASFLTTRRKFLLSLIIIQKLHVTAVYAQTWGDSVSTVSDYRLDNRDSFPGTDRGFFL
jgi:hypothetical protein